MIMTIDTPTLKETDLYSELFGLVELFEKGGVAMMETIF